MARRAVDWLFVLTVQLRQLRAGVGERPALLPGRRDSIAPFEPSGQNLGFRGAVVSVERLPAEVGELVFVCNEDVGCEVSSAAACEGVAQPLSSQ
jgi:hypothetical protein